MVKRMETADQVYEGGTPSKNNHNWEDPNRASYRTNEGGECASSSNLEKGRTGKLKRKHADRSRNESTGAKICMMHIPGHSTEECKVLREFSKKTHGPRATKRRRQREEGL